MDTQEIIELVKKSFEAKYNDQNFKIVKETISVNHREHHDFANDIGIEWMQHLPKMNLKPNVLQWIVEGDLVVQHSLYPPSLVYKSHTHIVDIWKIEGNKIVEHWDIVEEISKEAWEFLLPRNTQEAAGENLEIKDVVMNFLADVTTNKQFDKVDQYISEDAISYTNEGPINYRIAALDFAKNYTVDMQFKHVVASGKFVMVYMHVEFEGVVMAIADVFEVNNNKQISAKWTVSQKVTQ